MRPQQGAQSCSAAVAIMRLEFGLQYLFGVVGMAELDEAGRGRYTG